MLLYIKALHVISMVTWFAGLFYVVRLFIYRVESESKPEPNKTILTEQLDLMAKRLWYYITWPGMVLTVSFGLYLMIKSGFYRFGWMHLKLAMVFLLILYHLKCGKIRKALIQGTNTLTSIKLRIFNEVPTLLLVGIIFTIYLKDFFSGLWGITVLVLLMGGFMVVLKKKRQKKSK